ncbi:hypothetical protein GCM10009863_08610 [Streptomyces axinellae]|uniref:Uncharacterized protein n=1 Tax=Streptomyces axinellae TaxID=552788 RepID=A0ABP6C3K0_9ACTN
MRELDAGAAGAGAGGADASASGMDADGAGASGVGTAEAGSAGTEAPGADTGAVKAGASDWFVREPTPARADGSGSCGCALCSDGPCACGRPIEGAPCPPGEA